MSIRNIKKFKYYPWIIVLLSSFLLFYKYIALVFPSLIVGDLKLELGLSSSSIGLLSAIMLYVTLIIQPFSGALLDRFGYRYISSLSIFITAIGILGFAYCTDIVYVCIARGFMGIGVAFATVSYMKAVSAWFDEKKFAFASTFLLTAAMIGALGGQTPLSLLFEHVGWHQGLLYCALLGLVLSLIYWAIVRDPLTPMEIDASEKKEVIEVLPPIRTSVMTVIKNPNNWFLMLYSGLSFTTIDAFAGLWGNSFFQAKYHLSPTASAEIISFIFVGMAVGAPIWGKVSEKYDVRISLMFFTSIITFLCIMGILYVHLSFIFLSTLCFIYGISASTFMLSFVVGRRVNPIWAIATAAAIINTGEPILGGTFEWLIGAYLDYLQPHVVGIGYQISVYEQAFSILPMSIGVAILLLFCIKEERIS